MKVLQIVFLILSFILFVNSYGSECVRLPTAYTKGTSCGGFIPCQANLYCDPTATCSDPVAVGSSCYDPTILTTPIQCGVLASCRGTTGSTTCVTNSGAGQVCSTTGAQCGFGPGMSYLSCNPATNTCTGGAFGDGCTGNADCSSNMCSSGTCSAPVAGGACLADLECAPGFYCNNLQCAARLTSGTCVNGNDMFQCANGYTCMLASASATSSSCIQQLSLAEGDYCGIPANNVCGTNLRCSAGYCVSTQPEYCTTGNDCLYNHYCSCDGGLLFDGYGTCTKLPSCYSSLTNLQTCFNTNCENRMDFQAAIPFATSCLQTQCASQYATFFKCSFLLSLYGYDLQ